MTTYVTNWVRGALGVLLCGAIAACGSGSGTPTGTGGGGATGAAGAAGHVGAAGTGGGPGTAGAGPAGQSGSAGSGGGGAGGTAGDAGAGGGAAGAPGGAGGPAGAGGALAGRGGQSGGQSGQSGSSGAPGGRGGGAGAGGRGGSSGAGGTPADGGAAGTTGDAGGGYLPCPSTGACAVMPLGDSITEGYPANNGGYRVELFRQAVTNGKGLTFVGTLMNGPGTVASKTFPPRHEGHRGYTIDTGGSNSGISGQVVDQALASQPPKIVLLIIGTNDINRNVDVANAPVRLGKLLDEIIADAPAALVVVSTIIPIADTAINPKVQAYNAALPDVVSTRAAAGKHVVFVDSYAAFVKDPNYKTTLMADTLHPNDAGYALLGRTFYDAIAAALPAAP